MNEVYFTAGLSLLYVSLLFISHQNMLSSHEFIINLSRGINWFGAEGAVKISSYLKI